VAGRIVDFLVNRHFVPVASPQGVAASRAIRSVAASSRGPSGPPVGQ
jgi:hypothetical protein